MKMKMKTKKNILLLLAIAFVSIAMPVFSQKNTLVMNWDCLNLSKSQKQSIQQFDIKWQQIESSINPIILKDKKEFKKLINDYNVPEIQLKRIHNNILMNQDLLRRESLEIFLAKKHLLTQEQCKKFNSINCK